MLVEMPQLHKLHMSMIMISVATPKYKFFPSIAAGSVHSSAVRIAMHQGMTKVNLCQKTITSMPRHQGQVAT